MRTGILVRHSHEPKQTLGVFTILKTDGDIMVAKTLERPWLNNASNVSCIPPNAYLCKYTRSPRLSAITGRDFFTYELMNVPDRAGIRIHSFNYWFEGQGCIAAGDALKDINLDNVLDVTHTGKTIAAIEKELMYKDFTLAIMTA